MHKNRCNILIMGTLASGSSALKDMLREYDNVKVVPGEFDDYRAPGLVADLLSQDTANFPDAIREFLSRRSLPNRLVSKTGILKLLSGMLPGSFWNNDHTGKLSYLKTYLIRANQISLLEKLHNDLKTEIPLTKKIEKAHKWINDVGDFNAGEKEYVLFDQPLLPWSDVNLWMKVFDPFKAVCVLRDPKDQIAEIVKRGIIYSPFRSPFLNYAQVNVMSIYGNSRKSMIDFHVDALKGRLERICELKKIIPDDKLLLIDFEGMALKYEQYKPLIEDFLGIENLHHRCPKKYYDPDAAIRNSIGMFRNYLSKEDLDDLKDVEDLYNNRIKTSGNQ